MPLVDGRLVPVVKGPSNPNAPAWLRLYHIEATGETFFHEKPYENRLHYLRQPIFECQETGRQGLSYFAALESEKQAAEQERARQTQEQFPEEIKGRVLGSAQFQLAPRLDALCDEVYERYQDRFFVGEKVFVDLGGDKYYSRIAKVFPPRDVRGLARPDAYPVPSLPGSGTVVYDEFSRVSHAWGINLNVEPADAMRHDPAGEYLYTVQLMLGEGKFEGSFMELKAKALSRDRTVFSKAILRRFLRECLDRSAAPGAPWLVKPHLARAFGIPMLQLHADRARQMHLAESKYGKRKAPPQASGPDPHARRLHEYKKSKLEPTISDSSTNLLGSHSSRPLPEPQPPTLPPMHQQRPSSSSARLQPVQRRESATRDLPTPATPPVLKYPIEDLDLVRLNLASRNARRGSITRPRPKQTLPVSQDIFGKFVSLWSNLNVFARCLGLSTFTLDDFAQALNHSKPEPTCSLIVELHASLTNIIGSDNSRVFGTTGAPSAQILQRIEVDPDDMEIDELEDDTGTGDDADDAQIALNSHRRQTSNGDGIFTAGQTHELNVLLRRGISFSRRWDKSAKLKASNGRRGWLRHVVGALCQRGGPRVLPNLQRILEHLFENVPQTVDVQAPLGKRRDSTVSRKGEDEDENANDDDEQSNGSFDDAEPLLAYFALSVEDKIDILHYLCSLALGSKAARHFIDEGDTKLTELRKMRAERNRLHRSTVMSKKDGATNGTSNTNDTAEGNIGDGEDSVSSSPVKEGASTERRPSVFVLPTNIKKADTHTGRGSSPVTGRTSTTNEAGSTPEDQVHDWIKREMRRWYGVSRCRPLGTDRFMCKYWWLDGLGSMSLVSSDETVANGLEINEHEIANTINQWQTGRLLVQGPSAGDMEWATAQLGDVGKSPAKDDDLDRAVLVGVDEWGFLDDSKELDGLIDWLDHRGVRERELKTALLVHRNEILAAARQRHEREVVLAMTEPEPTSRRVSQRKKEENVVVAEKPYSQAQPNPCFRWSGQVAIARAPGAALPSNTTLWYYGGNRKLSSDQTDNLWTNALVALDLSKDWARGTPPLTLVQDDNGDFANPPAVALGALWASPDGSKLYQYAGQFQDNPDVPPPAQNTFVYDIASDEWSIVRTTGDDVGNPAEGAAAVAGDSAFFFSGHLDDHTTEGWSNQIARLYLNSMVQFDFDTLRMTNITSYSNNATSGANSQPEIPPVHRADGTLTYVPGLGTDGQGLLVSIGGATNDQFVDNSVLDVYDIGAQGWTKQATGGDTLGTRINHCAVRGTAKINGEITHQIYAYGGQQLNQSERDSAMYILNIQQDVWTWKFVGNDLPSQPVGRAGHQCALIGNQLIVMGGVVASNVLCENPSVFIYNTTGSNWQSNYKAGTTYSTPLLISNITGGVGTGGAVSGSGYSFGGDGSQFADTSQSGDGDGTGNDNGDNTSGSGNDSANDNSGTDSSNKDNGSSSSNAGPIAGGVVGAIAALAIIGLVAFLLLRKRKRDKQKQEAAAAARDKLGGAMHPLRSDSGSSEGRYGLPYEKQWGSPGPAYYGAYGGRRMSGSLDHSSGSMPYGAAASDDVEEDTRGMEAAFASPHLVPRQPLRVTNPEIRDDD
ncbi:hypothetical protein OIO90_006206 [Microbotryomycetes sp. JL221]|nr:hypothetical protein OIO90_006206 [Microbotryomycetes sp. JL221]